MGGVLPLGVATTLLASSLFMQSIVWLVVVTLALLAYGLNTEVGRIRGRT